MLLKIIFAILNFITLVVNCYIKVQMTDVFVSVLCG